MSISRKVRIRMQVVIEIPEDYYKAITEIPNHQCTADMLIIKNGTPLQKGHGRLIDADELEVLFGEKCVGDCGACMTKRKTDGRGVWYDTCSSIDISPTIIEADRAESEGKA